jgi:hypothetical protein
MKLILNHIRQKKQVQLKYGSRYELMIPWGELNRLDAMVKELDNDLRNFQKLLVEEVQSRNTGTRNKRGVMNVLGYGMKYLFGTADARVVKRLSGVCDELHAFEAKMAHVTEQQLTYIRTLDEMTKQNVRDTVDLARTLRVSIRNFSVQLGEAEANVIATQDMIVKQVKYSAAIREIEMDIIELKFGLIHLQESLDVTSAGKLSSVLINPYNLSVILQQVSLQLPAGLSMLTGLTVEEMYVYYTVAEVHAVATSKNIRLLIDIPLKATDRYFELYQVHSLPFFHKGIRKFMMIDEMFVYLAVAESRQFFAIFSPYLLSKCKQEIYTVCPSDVVLRTAGEQHCLTALFLGKEDIALRKCKRLVLNDSFEPIWIRSPDYSYWIYSLSSPQKITVQCHETGSPPNSQSSYQTLIEGTAVLLNSSSCYIHAETFKLLPHSSGQTMVNLTRRHIKLPDIDNVLNSWEERVLQPDKMQTEVLQHLDEIVERAASRGYARNLDVDKVAAMLRGGEIHNSSSSKPWVIAGIVVSIGLGVLCLGWCMYKGRQMRRILWEWKWTTLNQRGRRNYKWYPPYSFGTAKG